jgi:hypothetical protein
LISFANVALVTVDTMRKVGPVPGRCGCIATDCADWVRNADVTNDGPHRRVHNTVAQSGVRLALLHYGIIATYYLLSLSA